MQSDLHHPETPNKASEKSVSPQESPPPISEPSHLPAIAKSSVSETKDAMLERLTHHDGLIYNAWKSLCFNPLVGDLSDVRQKILDVYEEYEGITDRFLFAVVRNWTIDLLRIRSAVKMKIRRLRKIYSKRSQENKEREVVEEMEALMKEVLRNRGHYSHQQIKYVSAFFYSWLHQTGRFQPCPAEDTFLNMKRELFYKWTSRGKEILWDHMSDSLKEHITKKRALGIGKPQ